MVRWFVRRPRRPWPGPVTLGRAGVLVAPLLWLGPREPGLASVLDDDAWRAWATAWPGTLAPWVAAAVALAVLAHRARATRAIVAAIAAPFAFWVALAVLGAVAQSGWVVLLDHDTTTTFAALSASSPFVALGLGALRARESAARTLATMLAALSVLGVGATIAARGGSMSFHCMGPSLSPAWIADGTVQTLGARIVGASLAAALLAWAAVRDVGSVRAMLLAASFGCVVAAVGDAMVLDAATLVRSALVDLDGSGSEAPAAPAFAPSSVGFGQP